MKDLFIQKTELSIQFRETTDAFDKWPNLRAYCTQYPNQFNLQIRANAPLVTDKQIFSKNLKRRNLFATISLSKEEILTLAEYVKNYDLKEE